MFLTSKNINSYKNRTTEINKLLKHQLYNCNLDLQKLGTELQT